MVVTQVKETDCASVILDELAAVLVVHVERIVQTLNEVDECEVCKQCFMTTLNCVIFSMFLKMGVRERLHSALF